VIAQAMPTAQEWINALSVPRRVRVESSAALIADIQQRQQQKQTERQQKGQSLPSQKLALTSVAAFSQEIEIDIVPAYLLLRLGTVTTPAVENLADICSTWAYFRYLWAFEIPPPGTLNPALRLSYAAKAIDFHQKGLLSDEIGVGMAALLMDLYMSAPLAADVSVAMNDPAWPIELQDRATPDYLFFDSTQTNVFVVECKGTQTTRPSSVDQLRRGTEQVPSLVFTDGRKPPSLVIGTLLTTTGTNVFVIDPPGDDEPHVNHLEKPERIGKREWRVKDDKAFSRATRLISHAKLLSFAGADEEAAVKLEGARAEIARTPRVRARRTIVSENEFGTFIGVRERVPMKDRINVEVFQGIDRAVYDAILVEDIERETVLARDFATRALRVSGQPARGQPVRLSYEGNSGIVRSAGSDGSLLEVTISEG
jgi:hypothetical protein